MRTLACIVGATLLGIVLTAAVLEGLARLLAPERAGDTCRTDSGRGFTFKPNCISPPMKIAEGPWVTYATNDCGYRTAEPCGRRAPDQLRVAVIGTSIAHGYSVPYSETWAARATAALRSECRRPVDFQNLAFPLAADIRRPVWHRLPERMPAALALHPDAIVTLVNPVDLEFFMSTHDLDVVGYSPILKRPPPRSPIDYVLAIKGAIYSNSRALKMARHMIYRDTAAYVPLYLARGDEAQFLHPPFSPMWKMRLAIADRTFARIGEQADAEHVPWFVILVPGYAQVALASGARPPHIDPYAFNDAIRRIVTAHGGHFADLTSDMRGRKPLADYYYVVDSHPTELVHAVIARRAADLLRAEAPAFRSCGA